MDLKSLVRRAHSSQRAGITAAAAVRLALIAAVIGAIVVAFAGSPQTTAARRLPIALAAAAPAPAAAPAAARLTRYSLVNGCYSLRGRPGREPIAASDGPFRMRAAALGIYLLYGPQGNYLIDGGAGAPTATGAPSTAAEWQVTGSAAKGFTITDLATGTHMPVSFARASGCAVYPEAGVDATGRSFTGASPESDVLGTVEGHAHVTAFELFGGDWHCGTPWSPFGAPSALPASCAADEQGTNGEAEAFVDFGGATRPSGMHGWPTFVDWPSPTALAEESDYYTGIERAWKAGLRLMVTNLVDNEALCSLMTKRTNPCNDMSSVRIQSRDLYALQNYIDAQSGGPGKGWFRVVTDPFQARRVINQGKLAVIEGIEVSDLFGCGERNGTPLCDESQINAGLNEVWKLGVRTFFPVHEFDNAFGGSKMISGDTGALINAGNREETGSFFTLQPCPSEDQDAEQLSVAPAGAIATLLNGPGSSLLKGNPLPVYGSGPQCNTRGLTDLGADLINQMAKRHVIIQLDHMDSKTATAALAITTADHYAGVVSAHCCSSPQLFKGIYDTGGFVDPPVEPVQAFVNTWKADKALHDPKYHFGFGYGSDMNGLAEQPGPDPGAPISYPFKAYAGNVTFTKEKWGDRSFDLNTDGLANYGLYADWLNELQRSGGRPLMNDMFQGAEAYLEMWERAWGVPATSCRPATETFSSAGLGRGIHLGQSTEAVLDGAGQPLSRAGRSYRFCAAPSAGRGAAVVSVFNSRGRTALIASTASGDRAGRYRVGGTLGRPARGLRGLGHGAWVSPALPGGARYVVGVAAGRIRFLALASAADAKHPARLRADLRAAGV